MPEDPVENILRCPVDLLEVHPGAGHRPFPQERVEDRLRRGVHPVEGDGDLEAVVGRCVGAVGEAVEHRRGRGVELVHRAHPKDLVNRPQHARRVVLGADDGSAPGVGARHVAGRAVAADMVPARLRIVLDGEDRHLRPELAVRQRLDDPAEGEVVVGHAGLGCGAVGRGAAGVVVRQADDDEIRVFPTGLELRQLPDEKIGTELVGDTHLPPDCPGGGERSDRFDRRLRREDHVVLVDPIPPGPEAGSEVGLTGPFRILPPDAWLHELAVVADRLSVLEGPIPDEAGGGPGQGVGFAIPHAIGIAPRESGEAPLDVVAGHRRGAPVVAVGGEDAAAVGVVEEDKPAGDGVVIGGDIGAEHAQV